MNNSQQKPNPEQQIFLAEHSHEINNLCLLLDRGFVSGILRRTISILLEIVIFVTSLVLFVLGIYVPLNPLNFSEIVNQQTTVNTTIHNDQITTIMIAVKVIIFLSAAFVLFAGLVLRRNRKKSVLIQTAYDKAFLLKGNLEQARNRGVL